MSDAKERWLAEAEALLVEGGVAAVTVGAIAGRLRVSAPALYRHFPGRDALLRELSGRGWQAFRAALARATRRPAALDRLRACGRAYVRFGLTRPAYYRLLFSADGEAAPPVRRRRTVDAAASPGLALLVGLVEACQAGGDLPREARTADLAMAFWATCHGLVSLYLDGGAAVHFSRAAYLRLADGAIDGLLTR